jgi:hypothetical protein
LYTKKRGIGMTRNTNARIAGFTFLFYIATGIVSMIVFGRAGGGTDIATKLASIAQHVTEVRVVYLLGLLQSFCAMVLAVTLYAITREEDSDLAMLGLTFRVGEGLIGISIPTSLGLLWLATATGANAPDASGARALGAFLREVGGWTTVLAATFFAVGSTLFSWLLLRGRMIPINLARLGVAASVLLVVGLPLRGAGFLSGPLTYWMWLPMAAFEVTVAIWFLVKGVASPARRPSA